MSHQSDDTPQRRIKHVGVRPSNDQDNKCREKLCHIVKDVGCFYEICCEKLYLVYLAKDENLDDFLMQQTETIDSPFIFWSARDCPSLHYEPFNMDFGPFNLAVTHQFCSRLKVWLDTQPYREHDKHIVIILDDSDLERKLNVTLLVAIAAMVLLDMTDEEVLRRLNFFMMYNRKPGEVSKQLTFREKKKFNDVSGIHSLMKITLDDCIRAFYAALKCKFYDYYEFDHIEYLFYETVISGDLNWIVPGKLLAFAGPSDNQIFARHAPEFYYHYFKDHNVTSIVRLNEPEYRSTTFKKLGFEHHDLIFPDGYPPTSPIAAKFIKIVDEAKGAVAVHCYAGIGRTGTLIAAYLMARYRFTPQMAVAWTRICRPGSVIGGQQDWLFTKFDQYKFQDLDSVPMGDISKPTRARKAKAKDGAESTLKHPNPGEVLEPDAKVTYAVAEKTYGQARALVMTKKQREAWSQDRPKTRNQEKSNLKRQSIERGSTESDELNHETNVKGAKRTAADIILNLGKTVPWELYDEDIIPLKGKKNPDTYRLRDKKYEWRVKFPQSDYVTFRHGYDLNKSTLDDRSYESRIRRILLDFMYEQTETKAVTKSPSKKTRSKPIDLDDDLDVEVCRLRPVVLFRLVSHHLVFTDC